MLALHVETCLYLSTGRRVVHPRQFFSLALKAVALLLIGRTPTHLDSLVELVGRSAASVPSVYWDSPTEWPWSDWLLRILCNPLVVQLAIAVLMFGYSDRITRWLFRGRRVCRVCGHDVSKNHRSDDCPECCTPFGTWPPRQRNHGHVRTETRAFARSALRLTFRAIGAMSLFKFASSASLLVGVVVLHFIAPLGFSAVVMGCAALAYLLLLTIACYWLYGAPQIVDWLIPVAHRDGSVTLPA